MVASNGAMANLGIPETAVGDPIDSVFGREGGSHDMVRVNVQEGYVEANEAVGSVYKDKRQSVRKSGSWIHPAVVVRGEGSRFWGEPQNNECRAPSAAGSCSHRHIVSIMNRFTFTTRVATTSKHKTSRNCQSNWRCNKHRMLHHHFHHLYSLFFFIFFFIH